MAYTHTKEERTIYGGTAAVGGVFTGTGDIAWFAPAVMPVRIRRLAVVTLVALTVQASIFSFDFQPIAGSAAGRVTAYGGTMTVPLTNPTSAIGNVYVTPELNIEILPGGRLVVNQTQASTAGSGLVIAYMEMRWEGLSPKTGSSGVMANNAVQYLLTA